MTKLTPKMGKSKKAKSATPKKPTVKKAETKGDSFSSLPEFMEATKNNLSPALTAMQSLYTRKVIGEAVVPLIEDDNDLLSVSITRGNIGNSDSPASFHKFSLPHPLHSLAASSVCVIVADHLDEEEKHKYKAEVDRSARHYEMLFAQHGVKGIDLVVSNTQLKREYNTHEGRAALAQAYDVFVVDRRVNAQVIKFMGPNFQKKGKYPQLADLEDPTKAAATIQQAVGRVTFKIGQFAPLISCKFGRATWKAEPLLENALFVVENCLSHLPGGWKNVKSVAVSHRKFPHIPVIRQQVTNASTLKRTAKQSVVGELTCGDMSVVVTGDGHVKVGGSGKKERRVAVDKFTDEESFKKRVRGRLSVKIQKRATIVAKAMKKKKAGEKREKEGGDEATTPVKKTKESPKTEGKSNKKHVEQSVEKAVAGAPKHFPYKSTTAKKTPKKGATPLSGKVAKKIKMVTADGDEKRAANKANKKKTPKK